MVVVVVAVAALAYRVSAICSAHCDPKDWPDLVAVAHGNTLGDSKLPWLNYPHECALLYMKGYKSGEDIDTSTTIASSPLSLSLCEDGRVT